MLIGPQNKRAAGADIALNDRTLPSDRPAVLQLGKVGLYSGGFLMQQNYTAVIKQDAGWWIGWIEEIPGVNCQEQSREALVETLRVTLREALELNRQEALGATGGNFEEASIAV